MDFVDPNLGKITDVKCGQVRVFILFLISFCDLLKWFNSILNLVPWSVEMLSFSFESRGVIRWNGFIQFWISWWDPLKWFYSVLNLVVWSFEIVFVPNGSVNLFPFFTVLIWHFDQGTCTKSSKNYIRDGKIPHVHVRVIVHLQYSVKIRETGTSEIARKDLDETIYSV